MFVISKKWVFWGACLLGSIYGHADGAYFYFELKALSTQADAVRPKEDPSGVLIAKDPTVGILPLTEELGKNPVLSDWVHFDPGFQKWVILFREIPGEEPYSIQLKRTAHFKPEAFVPVETTTTSEKVVLMKKHVGVVPFVLSARGFLPGESVTCRLATKDPKIYREISLCPRPLILKKTSGEILLKATLQKYPYEHTSYDVEISGVKENEYFKFLSKSGSEVMRNILKGPVFINYAPGVLGLKGGVAHLEISLDDGTSYKIDFPWGIELFSYKSGKK